MLSDISSILLKDETLVFLSVSFKESSIIGSRITSYMGTLSARTVLLLSKIRPLEAGTTSVNIYTFQNLKKLNIHQKSL